MAKILVVEDDASMAEVIQKWLSGELHNVEISLSGQDGLERMLAGHYDLIILDVGLPDIDGREVCRKYREGGGSTPVLILTGKGQIKDRVDGLDCGADDYLIKPCSLQELSARLRALLRRSSAVRSDNIACGNIVLDMTSHEVRKNGVLLTLLPVDYALLEFLMRHQNKLFSADALLDKVWPTDKALTENAVRSSVRRLRIALDDHDGLDDSISMIETVSKLGYRLRSRR